MRVRARMHACACVRARACVCVLACVCVRVFACVRECICVFDYGCVEAGSVITSTVRETSKEKTNNQNPSLIVPHVRRGLQSVCVPETSTRRRQAVHEH